MILAGHGVHRCATYACVGHTKRGGSRPRRHHGSMAVLLGPRLGGSLPRAREDEVSLEEAADLANSWRFRGGLVVSGMFAVREADEKLVVRRNGSKNKE